jgi:hypothetical protein
MANVDCILQIEGFDQCRQVISISVEIITDPRLAGTPVATSVMSNAAESARSQEEHLVFEGIRTEGPSVAEDDGLAGSPVIIVDLRSVFSGDSAHGSIGLWLGDYF